MKVKVVDVPEGSRNLGCVVSNQPPLEPSRLAKLPVGNVEPMGWIAHQIGLMVDGMTGRLQELSKFLAEDNGWFGTQNDGWEEQPYWLRGFYDLGILSRNERIRSESLRWIEKVMETCQGDGYFGPPAMKEVVGANGRILCDLWPHMVMFDALRSHWEATQDQRVLDLGLRFFRFCETIPEDRFIPPWDDGFRSWRPFIQWTRAGDMLPHIYWLYNLTRWDRLLCLASRFHEHVQPPEGKWLNHHVVHFTQRFREPGNYYVQSHNPAHLEETEYWYEMHMAEWGQQPGGAFAADERIRPGKTDPKQGIETCAMIEFNKSFYILGEITGQALYADRVEDIIFNSFPAAQTPDLKALHYLTAANMPQLDASTNHDFYNKGRQLDYSPHIYRCCQHNVAMGWPYFVEHLWMATPGPGLCAWMYGPCKVSAEVQPGRRVTIVEDTGYPFDTSVTMRFALDRQMTFPLYLRVPRWCLNFLVSLNGRQVNAEARPGTYVMIEREWSPNDVVEIEMPVKLSLTVWKKSGNSVTVNRGPLSFSLKIGEKWRESPTGTREWPDWEVFPTTPWNYGLIVNHDNLESQFKVIERHSIPEQPWTIENAPIEIGAKGKQIPNWTMIDETVTDLQSSPIRSDQPTEEIALIPMGCARLRMSCLPTIGDGPDAKEWVRVSSHEEAMKLRIGSVE